MAHWTRLVAVVAIILLPLAASAEERVLTLVPDRTSVTFNLKATGHQVNGLLVLEAGQIRFDSRTGAASGAVTFDLHRAATGNRLRDKEMREDVLETDRYPALVFHPERLAGALAPAGTSLVTLSGTVDIHGGHHELVLPTTVHLAGDRATAETTFEVPYVAWGLKRPSFLFLRAAPVVTVTVKAEGNLRSANDKP